MEPKPGESVLANWALVILSEESLSDGIPELRWELHTLIVDGARNVVVDVSRVELLSSSALACLLSTHRACRSRGGGVIIRRPNRRTLDLLRHTGLHLVFSVEEST